MTDYSLSLFIYGIVFLLCVTQWSLVKVILYKRFHFAEKNIEPRKLTEKEKIRQKTLVLFFLPLIFIVLFLEKIPAKEMVLLSLVFLLVFFVSYYVINRVLR